MEPLVSLKKKKKKKNGMPVFCCVSYWIHQAFMWCDMVRIWSYKQQHLNIKRPELSKKNAIQFLQIGAVTNIYVEEILTACNVN